jgi:cAMP phosphodiesterase
LKIRVLGCYGGQLLGFHLTSFLVNESILLDAGCPTEALRLEEQHRIRHLFVSHTHLDHIKDIGFLADNRSLKRMGGAADCLTVYSLQENLEALQTHYLNDCVWPDFTRLPTAEDPILRLQAIAPGKAITVDGVSVTPIPVNHPVPCTGFMLEQAGVQFLYTADTGHTDEIWQVANAQPNLKGIILDCSFPNAYQRLADVSGHLTANGVAAELEKLARLGEIPVYLYHMKPEMVNVMAAEIENLNIPHLRMLSQVDELLL